MSLTSNSRLKKPVAKITAGELEKAKAYIHGAVYYWCNNKKDDWFFAGDLFGKDNYFWNTTPLHPIWKWHNARGAKDPVLMAGRDVGSILKEILKNDTRTFDTRKVARRQGWPTCQYKWKKI